MLDNSICIHVLKIIKIYEGISYTLKWAKEPHSTRPETSAYWDMSDVPVITTADALCGSHEFQHNFQLLLAQRCTIRRNFWFHSNLLNGILYSLLEYIKVSDRRWIHQSH
jgi:hypothetical protein